MRQTKHEISILRIFACFLVIVSHLVCLCVFTTDYNQWDKANALYVARNACVPLFLCITGVVAMNKEKKYSFYIKKALRFFILFLIFMGAFSLYRDRSPLSDGITIGGLINIYKNGIYNQAHLWYLPLVAKIYLILPILKKIVESEKITKIYLGIWLWTSALYPLIANSINVFLADSKPTISDVMVQTLSQTTVSELYSYSGFVILGYYLYNYFSKKINIFALAGTLIGTIIIGSLLNYFTFQAKNVLFSHVWEYLSIFAVVPTICLVLIAKDYLSKLKINDMGGKIIGTISACTFGIYLIHPVLTEFAYKYFVNVNLYFSIPVAAIIIFIICCAAVFLYRLIVQGIKGLFGKIKASKG